MIAHIHDDGSIEVILSQRNVLALYDALAVFERSNSTNTFTLQKLQLDPPLNITVRVNKENI
jgi:hypothetical protein